MYLWHQLCGGLLLLFLLLLDLLQGSGDGGGRGLLGAGRRGDLLQLTLEGLEARMTLSLSVLEDTPQIIYEGLRSTVA